MSTPYSQLQIDSGQQQLVKCVLDSCWNSRIIAHIIKSLSSFSTFIVYWMSAIYIWIVQSRLKYWNQRIFLSFQWHCSHSFLYFHRSIKKDKNVDAIFGHNLICLILHTTFWHKVAIMPSTWLLKMKIWKWWWLVYGFYLYLNNLVIFLRFTSYNRYR